MLTRNVIAVVAVVALHALPTAAQPPTTPATIDVTCHGLRRGCDTRVQLHPGGASAAAAGDVRSAGRVSVQRRKDR